ncbi:MAG TPA: cell division protein FtsZ [Burkholderiaceae bacterium]|nr:cell division protein FtsZ [Burkholderiaceae bacterium]
MSNSLTIALASLGGVVLAGVIAHGAWAARRAGPKRADALPERTEPREPVMDGVAAPAEAGDAGPTLAALHSPAPERRASKRLTPKLDALIDAIATLRLDAPIGGAQAIAQLPTTRRAGGKPFIIEGLDSESGEWEAPSAGQHYGEFQAGVQLANRTGALNEIEYSEFVQKIQAFADAIGAMADFPDMLEAVAGARELDHFASAHDAQLAVQLRARAAAWSVGYIQQHAGRHGFVPGVVPGRLVMPAAEEGAPPVLTLTFDSQAALADDPNLAAVREVTLSFDVPQTDPSAHPFAAWQASAQALAQAMDARIVDDHGRELGTESFAAIGSELGQLYAALEGRDLAAGTAAARRLFS